MGDISSGKSSLIQTLLGDMLHLNQDFMYANEYEGVEDELFSQKVLSQSHNKYPPGESPVKVNQSIAYL